MILGNDQLELAVKTLSSDQQELVSKNADSDPLVLAVMTGGSDLQGLLSGNVNNDPPGLVLKNEDSDPQELASMSVGSDLLTALAIVGIESNDWLKLGFSTIANNDLFLYLVDL